MPPVDAHAADGLGHPGGVAGEQLVVLRGAGEFHQAQLHDEVIHEFLDLLLGVAALGQVPLRIDIDKGRGPSQGHGGAVLLLDRGQVAEVGPLDRFLYVCGRLGNVKAIDLAQLF